MSETTDMRDWCERYKYDGRVLAWLAKFPPPPEWKGTALEYAYTEMPFLLGGIAPWAR